MPEMTQQSSAREVPVGAAPPSSNGQQQASPRQQFATEGHRELFPYLEAHGLALRLERLPR